MATRYVPDRGDIVWLMFDPQVGHEQAGHRPAVVLSPRNYNKASGLALMCPMTTKVKGYPFEVSISSSPQSGVVLADQIKSLDWTGRKATRKGAVSAQELEEIQAKCKALIG